MDDVTVLAAAATYGDDVALGELVARTQPAVLRVCRALADPDEVDDVAQEAYLRIVEALPRFRFESPVLPWMLAITRHTCADAVRRARRRRRLRDRLAVQPAAPPAAAADGALDDLVAGLPPDRRLAFELTQLLGLSYEEAAAVCGCPPGTIRSRVARARSELAARVRRADSA